MRTWLSLMAAAAAEVGWVAGVNAADNAFEWAATAVSIVASFGLALIAARRLPATTVYVVFVGLGAIGMVAVDIAVFGAALHVTTLAFFALLLAAIVGLKLTAQSEAGA